MSRQAAISRRSVLGGTGLVWGGIASGMRSAAAVPTASALALCGDESHNSDYIRTALTSTLVEGAGLTIDFTDQEKLVSYENLKNYKILIMFRDGLRFPDGYYQAIYWTGKPQDIVSQPPLEKKIGGRSDIEGAIYTGHPPIRPFKVQITNREHPITRGVNDFVVTDEQHYVTCDKDPKYVLARSVKRERPRLYRFHREAEQYLGVCVGV